MPVLATNLLIGLELDAATSHAYLFPLNISCIIILKMKANVFIWERKIIDSDVEDWMFAITWTQWIIALIYNYTVN